MRRTEIKKQTKLRNGCGEMYMPREMEARVL
jgi:hypothetical protein